MELCREGRVQKLRSRRYLAIESGKSITGTIHIHPKGYGFVTPDGGGPDIYIPKNGLRDVFPRDRVQIKPLSNRDEGKIQKILERGVQQVVGVIKQDEFGEPYVLPIGREFSSWIYLKAPLPSTLFDQNEPVGVVSIDWKASTHDFLQGRLKQILGSLMDPSVDTPLVAHRHGLSLEFSKGLLSAAEETRPPQDDRMDLKHVPFVTVDGDTAHDFDDAIALDDEGNLWVAIADVSCFVPPESPLDLEAAKRGNSFYFPDRALPMLPPALSSEACSLKPNEERLALVLKTNFNEDPPTTEIYRARIISKRRLTYASVWETLNRSPKDSTEEMLHRMLRKAKSLFKERMEIGGVDFDFPEINIQLDAEQETANLGWEERTWAHRIVEEFMLWANKEVARTLSEKGFSLPFRVHDVPVQQKLSDFLRILRNYGYEIGSKKQSERELILYLIQRFEKDDRKDVFHNFLLRSMSQARYSTENIGHFGLGFSHYCHFTSPIRRYSDLLVHRLIHLFLDQKGSSTKIFPREFQTLQNVCVHISEQERKSVTAEREIQKVKGIRFLNERSGETFSGRITGMVSKGLFVELIDVPIEGFVHVSFMRKDRFHFDEQNMVMKGRRWGKTYRLGDPVKVRTIEASLERIQIDFALT